MLHQDKGYETLQDSIEDPQTHVQYARWSAGNLALLFLSHLAAVLAGLSFYKLIRIQGTTVPVMQANNHVQNKLFSAVPSELTSYSQLVKFNGTIDHPSIYRGASPEVDRAWSDLVDIDYIDLDLSKEDISKLGIDPVTAAQFPPENGGGYLVSFEFAHQLHCVDLLRKVTHWNYPHYMDRKEEDNSFQHSDKAFRIHVDHCIEMLRQVLMCRADTTLIVNQWVSVRHKSWPNFNTLHECRDFDAVHSWARKHEKENQTEPLRPKGAKMLKVPP